VISHEHETPYADGRRLDQVMTPARHGSDEARQAQDIRRVFDTIPTLAWSARSEGSADFFNRRWLDYTGLSVEEARDWGWTAALHPDDLKGLVAYWRSVLASCRPGEIEARLRRFDGMYRWFLFRAMERLSSGSERTPTSKTESARNACSPERISFWK
jgi:PAS domain S-box-containing protein